MLLATAMPRVFSFKSNGQNIKLPDPDPNWSLEAVLDYYAFHYPVLGTATIQKPIVRDDTLVVEFTSTIGTKG